MSIVSTTSIASPPGALPRGPHRTVGPLNDVVILRVSKTDKKRWQLAADNEDRAMSEWMREACYRSLFSTTAAGVEDAGLLIRRLANRLEAVSQRPEIRQVVHELRDLVTRS